MSLLNEITVITPVGVVSRGKVTVKNPYDLTMTVGEACELSELYGETGTPVPIDGAI